MRWKPLAEARGVTVNQLDSIDPTLVVYRAEAVFVGVGLWDLLSVVSTPGAAVHWDKSFDDAILLEDVNELSDLWHLKTKAAWPVQYVHTPYALTRPDGFPEHVNRSCYEHPTSLPTPCTSSRFLPTIPISFLGFHPLTLT